MSGSEGSAGGEREYTFVCPECGESIQVNAPMRDALVDNGCVICGAAVSPESFSVPESGP